LTQLPPGRAPDAAALRSEQPGEQGLLFNGVALAVLNLTNHVTRAKEIFTDAVDAVRLADQTPSRRGTQAEPRSAGGPVPRRCSALEMPASNLSRPRVRTAAIIVVSSRVEGDARLNPCSLGPHGNARAIRGGLLEPP
jgi:hypothetical protein